ncbi:MAG: hypothetical protein D6791_09250 [Chloroflexi bacterium]|nr:MAG: hypothetical protein D6791_09250 [Chloroflexota bacterium]
MDREQLMRRWWETAYEFAEAVITENQAAVSAMTVPDSEVDLTYRIFGFAPLIFLMKGHLKHPALTASRAAWNRETGEDVRIEVSWINEQGQPARDGQVTFHLQWMQPGWRVAQIRPAGLTTPMGVDDAREMFEAQEGDRYAVGLVAGTVQVKRDGPEELDAVEDCLVAGMQERRFGLSEILTAVRLWRDFRGRARPIYRRPEGYAAAVEYIVRLLGLYEGSLALASEQYGVSKSTVSRNYREIRDELNIVQFDPRYGLLEGYESDVGAIPGEIGDGALPAVPLGFGRAQARNGRSQQ